MVDVSARPRLRALDPMERISEVLFGLIMALTFTCTLAVATADDIKVQAMLVGALGCNLAWGIIDAGVYLLENLNDRGRARLFWSTIRDAPDPRAAQHLIAGELPPLLASVVPTEQLELMRQELQRLPEPAGSPRLTRHDLAGAFGLCLLSFVSAVPIVIPFIVIGDARLALRVSNLVAIAMLFLCGYAFGHRSGFRPWLSGLWMVAVGAALVAVAIALGG